MSGDLYTHIRYFNTSGPCVPDLHYMLPPEPRLPGARELINEGLYFVVHAPRQTGKTTTLGALARDVTADGRQVAHPSPGTAQGMILARPPRSAAVR